MLRPRKPSSVSTVEKPAHFFNDRLAGEEPLAFATADRLCRLSASIVAIRPWEFLADKDLFLLKDPMSGEMCHCSVMGALGEVFSLYVYIGSESYRFFRKVAAGEPVSSGDFRGSQTGVSVEYVGSAEVTPPDRELLRHFGHPTQKGVGRPIFRALRPGYYPWYVTEAEGRLLAECMQALVVFCNKHSKQTVNYWTEKDTYPLLVPMPDSPESYKIEIVKVPIPLPAMPKPSVLDEARLSKLRAKDYAMRGCFEADCFYAMAKLGARNERKSFVRIGLVTDAKSGFLFPPEIGMAARSLAEVLPDAILKAIETIKFLPEEIRLDKEEFKTVLAPLAQQLGISLRVVKSSPAVREAKQGLLAMMGDPSAFRP